MLSILAANAWPWGQVSVKMPHTVPREGGWSQLELTDALVITYLLVMTDAVVQIPRLSTHKLKQYFALCSPYFSVFTAYF
jgi:hypothetical protein